MWLVIWPRCIWTMSGYRSVSAPFPCTLCCPRDPIADRLTSPQIAPVFVKRHDDRPNGKTSSWMMRRRWRSGTGSSGVTGTCRSIECRWLVIRCSVRGGCGVTSMEFGISRADGQVVLFGHLLAKQTLSLNTSRTRPRGLTCSSKCHIEPDSAPEQSRSEDRIPIAAEVSDVFLLLC